MNNVITLSKYTLSPKLTFIGTQYSYGLNTLTFEFDDTWNGLMKTISFYPNGLEPFSMDLIGTNTIEVPSILSQYPQQCKYVVSGLKDGVEVVSIVGNLYNTQTLKPITSQPPKPPTQTMYVKTVAQFVPYIKYDGNTLQYSLDGITYKSVADLSQIQDGTIIVGTSKDYSPDGTIATEFSNKQTQISQNSIDITNLQNTKADKTEIPTKTSQLTNDSGFLTSIPSEYVTDTEMQAYAQPKGDYATNIALNTEITNRQNTDNTLQQNIDNINNKVDNLQSVQILNKGVINSTIANVQNICSNYIVAEYGRQPKNLDGLIITLTDSVPPNDKVQYVYSGFSNVWVDTGSAQIEITEGSKTEKGVLQVGDGINVVSGVISTNKETIGLGNVDNTSDLNKPISTATQNALNLKANSADLSIVATSGSYNDLLNKPIIPSKTSELVNDSDYQTLTQVSNAISVHNLSNIAHQDIRTNVNEIDTRLQQDQLKVAKVEKELNDYKSTLANVNVNQEAKQKISGYGTISLPKTTANGQVSSIGIKGLTATNLVKNGNFGNEINGWTFGKFNSSIEVIDGIARIGIKYIGYPTVYGMSIIKDNKYYISAEIKNETLTNGMMPSFGFTNGQSTTGQSSTVYFSEINTSSFSRISRVLTANDNYTSFAPIRVTSNSGDATFAHFDDITIINLTQTFGAGNEPTVEQCDKIFVNYLDGTKSTISASRLKSVGKNLCPVKSSIGINQSGITIFPIKAGSIISGDITGRVSGMRLIVGFYSDFININGLSTSEIQNSPLQISRVYLAYDTQSQLINYVVPSAAKYVVIYRNGVHDFDNLIVSYGSTVPFFEPYTESTAYLPNVGELRSLPNGTKDEIRVSGGKAEHIQRNKKKILEASDILSLITTNPNTDVIAISKNQDDINYNKGFNIITTGSIYEYTTSTYSDSISEIGKIFSNSNSAYGLVVAKGTYVDSTSARTALAGLELTYQLAQPIVTPIEVGGTLLSNHSGTVYIENVVADAGIYDSGITTQYTNLPIKEVDKLIKYNFETGVQTSLDTTKVVINANKLSFTHPNLADGDMVFFDYYYDLESTEGEVEIEYYDSRYTIKDTTNGKFYSWKISSTNGVASVALTEVL